MATRRGVLLMAYGTPRNLDEVEPFFRDIRGGRQPSPEAVAELTERYRSVGGKTPLLAITERLAALLETRLNRLDGDEAWRVYVGMKHWHPYIDEALDRIAEDGVRELVALPFAPHYSRLSITGYEQRVRQGLERLSQPPAATFIQSWSANPRFVELIARRIEAALDELEADPDEVEVVFSAHSLPARIVDSGDPYPDELLRSAEAVARAAGVQSWRFAYQSAGRTPEPWLGPDILETIDLAADEGIGKLLLAPFGFVCDHLEILYDIDIEARRAADRRGVALSRIAMPNDDPAFVDVLLNLVRSGDGARTTKIAAAR